MVRHGRLSKGCLICRKRKIKCDQVWPACNQCLKAGWKCPQYGDSVDRMFQNLEIKDFSQPTALEILKSKLSPSVSAAASLSSSLTTAQKRGCTLLPRGSSPVNINIPKNITQSINDRAIDFFLSTHAFRECGTAVRGHYEYLSGTYNDLIANKTLFTTLSAAALAAYAYTFRYPDLLKEATRHYGRALCLINNALSAREETIKNSTVISILLLSTFETITGRSSSSLSHCSTHTRGALTIINLRGNQMIECRHGQQLFLQTYWCFFLNSILHSTRIPREAINLRRYAETCLDENDPSWRFLQIGVKMANFRADVKDRILHDHRSIVDAALGVDREFSSLVNNMPVQWQFQTALIKQTTELVLGTYYHIYPDLWMATIWNNIRTCRLHLHKEICNQLEDIFAETPGSFSSIDAVEYQHSLKFIQQMSFDICATVAQYCGHLAVLSSGILQNEGTMSKDSITSGIPTAAGLYFLIWPLFNAGQVADSDTQRNWIINRSRNIGRVTGIQQAFVLADIIQSREEVPV